MATPRRYPAFLRTDWMGERAADREGASPRERKGEMFPGGHTREGGRSRLKPPRSQMLDGSFASRPVRGLSLMLSKANVSFGKAQHMPGHDTPRLGLFFAHYFLYLSTSHTSISAGHSSVPSASFASWMIQGSESLASNEKLKR